MTYWSFLVIVLGLAGCGDDGTTPTDGGRVDSGGGTDGGGGTDAGNPDDRSFDALLPGVPPAEIGRYDAEAPGMFVSMGPADLTCLGTRTGPTPGAASTFTITIEDFETGNIVPEVCFKLYPDNIVPVTDSCAMGGMMTDMDGQATVMGMADGWYALRVFPKPGPTDSLTVVGSVQFNEPAPAGGGMTTGNSVSMATLELIPTVFGFPRGDGSAIVAGEIQDCMGRPMRGALVRFARTDGSYIVEGTRALEPHYRYFDGDEFPSDDSLHSHVDGLYAAANIPVTTQGEEIFIEVWGRRAAGMEPEILGCEQGRLYGDTVTIVNLGPLRSDGPACPALE